MGRVKAHGWKWKQGEENGGMESTGNETIDQRPEADDEVARSSGDTIPNSVAGAGVRASAVWDFLRVVAWVRAFAV